jgi:hypothetical protein
MFGVPFGFDLYRTLGTVLEQMVEIGLFLPSFLSHLIKYEVVVDWFPDGAVSFVGFEGGR